VNRKGESIYHLPGGRWPGAKLQRDTLAKIVRTELGNYEMHHPPADEAVAFVECMYTIDATFPKALAIAFRSHSILSIARHFGIFHFARAAFSTGSFRNGALITDTAMVTS